MCSPHYDALKAGIEARGLSALVAKTPGDQAAVMQADLEGQPTRFDPLWSAIWALYAAALEEGGLAMLAGEPERCPLCEADAHGGHANDWLNGCLDAQLKHARQLGLVPGVQ